MKVYIAGRISDLDIEVVRDKFQRDENLLAGLGYVVVNPTKITGNNDETWTECMTVCIRELVLCDAIYLQPDWEYSKGAQLEWFIAKSLDMVIMFPSRINRSFLSL